jgi:polysaccharide chain length determinant protein (PEP-CTERM system associated)
MPSQTSDLVTLLLKEGKRRLIALTTMFSVVAILALVVDLLVPKKWEASALLIAESSNIIKPLMEGRAVATGITDQTALVTQTIMSKRIMRELLADGGWLKKKLSPKDELNLILDLRSRVHIDTPREQTIHIVYTDSDPKRAYELTNKIAEIYVRESTNLKEQESREAFDFINERVKEYGGRLNDDHSKLLAYYHGQGKALAQIPLDVPATDEAAPPPSDALAPKSKISPEELVQLRAEEATLTAQLGHKAGTPSAAESLQVEEQYRSRVLQLQNDLDRLLVTYTDEHPDVKRARRDLAVAKEELKHTEQARLDHENAKAAAVALDDELTRAARARLEVVQTKLASATGIRRRPTTRSASSKMQHAAAVAADADPEMRGVGQDTTLSELSRRYEATRDVYQDLLKRRENARVSMDLDAERRGMTMRIEEPAEMPVVASGLRLFQLSLIGLIVAVMVPLAYLFAIVRLDPRVRSPEAIERVARVPLLVTIPGAARRDGSSVRRRGLVAATMVAGVFVVYVAVLLVRMKITST